MKTLMDMFGASLLVVTGCSSGDGGAAPTTLPPTTESTTTTVDPTTQPWIVYEGPIPGTVGNVLVRPDGGANHAATLSVKLPKDGWQVHPDWSPDGQQLVFAADDADDEGVSRDLRTRDIWMAGFEGSNPERVFNCTLPCVEADDPAWSPDGKSIVFTAFDDDHLHAVNFRLAVFDVATKKVSTVFVAEGADELGGPRWSPDGTRVVFELQHWTDSGPTGENTETAIAVLDLRDQKPAVKVITPWDMWATYPDWNRQDDRIVFSTRPWDALATGPSNLYTVRPDGTELTQLTSFEKGETRAAQPTWTPDGSQIIFTAVEGEGFGKPTMAIINPDGTGLTSATTSGPMFGTHPRLRPVG